MTRKKALAAAVGIVVLGFGAISWVNRSSTVTGEIRDGAIVLSTDRAGSVANFDLRNSGSQPCDLIVVLTSLAIDALPSEGGRVVTYDGSAVQMGPDGRPPAGVPVFGFPDQINGTTAPFGQSLQPGDVARFQVAFNSTPRTDNRVVLCNGPDQYAAGRRALLAFER